MGADVLFDCEIGAGTTEGANQRVPDPPISRVI
jgi:hypothetical protein